MINFHNKCYQLLSQIPEGRVSTYKEIARALNSKAYRAVGKAMAKNQDLVSIPCHRVVRSDGMIGKYSLGIHKKSLLLQKEGISIKNGKIIDFKKYFYSFK